MSSNWSACADKLMQLGFDVIKQCGWGYIVITQSKRPGEHCQKIRHFSFLLSGIPSVNAKSRSFFSIKISDYRELGILEHSNYRASRLERVY